MNNNYLIIGILSCLQIHFAYSITTAVALFKHPSKKQNIILVHDTHYESYHTAKKKRLKQLIKQQSDELIRIISFLSAQQHLSVVIAESNPYYCKHVKKERKCSIFSAVVNHFCKKEYACSGNVMFVPLDYRCWIDGLMLKYTSTFYKVLILFNSDEQKAVLEEALSNIPHFDKLIVGEYLEYVNCFYRRSLAELRIIQEQTTAHYPKILEEMITKAYNIISNSFKKYVGKK